MKHFTILFIAAILIATGCSKSANDLLVGTWKANSFKITTKSSTNTDTVIDVTPFLVISPVSFTFNACASATSCEGSSIFNGVSSKFNYQLSSDEKSISAITTDSAMTKMSITITELTASSLKVTVPIPAGASPFNPMSIASGAVTLTK